MVDDKLLGGTFDVYTDNNPLTYILTSAKLEVVKAVVHKGEMNTSSTIEPELIYDDLKIFMRQLVSKLAGKMRKAQWKIEQQVDPEIGPVMQLVLANKHLQHKFQKDDNPGSKIILHFRDNLKLVDGLLYRKWVYKDKITYLQFVLPCEFCKCTVISCHDQFGHLGMDKTLILLQERFFWPKMSDDVRHHIHNCECCLHFRQKPE